MYQEKIARLNLSIWDEVIPGIQIRTKPEDANIRETGAENHIRFC